MDIIALVGLPGAGKSTVAAMIAKYGYAIVRFGDVTDHELTIRDLPINDENEKWIAQKLRSEKGMAIYAELNIPRIDEHDKVVIDGVRSWEEAYTLRKNYGHRMRIILVDASPEVRYPRLKDRQERPLDEEQCKERDRRELEDFDVRTTINNAETTIKNEGTLDDLHARIEEIFLKRRTVSYT